MSERQLAPQMLMAQPVQALPATASRRTTPAEAPPAGPTITLCAGVVEAPKKLR
ncbi:MAG TPA: hypothetical protein VKQ36_16685 [Ktedonobacterales bacterium]|nr:hypothetical protein [Ktedonobacterales bacterium]